MTKNNEKAVSSRTKEIEGFYYKKFQKAYSLPEEFSISDKPDIRIDHNGKKIGIEVTSFYLEGGSNIEGDQRQSPIRERVVKKAQCLYETKNGRNIEVTLGFNTINNERGLAEKIADWIEKNKTEQGHISLDRFSHISELRSVYVNLGPYEDAKWRVLQVYSIPNTSPKQLQEIISDKEDKLDQYQQNLDEIWLLIVIDFINLGMDQEPHNVDYSKISVKKFNKVFMFKTGFDYIFEFSKT